VFTWDSRDKRSSFSTVPQPRPIRHFLVSPFLATHTKNAPVSPFVATLTKTKDLKSFVCHTYEKTPGGPPPLFRFSRLSALVFLALAPALAGAHLRPQQPPQPSAAQAARQQWKTVPFAIVRYNDDAPKSWNVYRGEKKGVYLVRLWKRYLVVDTGQQSAFEIDPAKVKVEGDNAELSPADIPADPIETSEWKSRDAGPVLRHRFRFGTTGNFMELQIPLQINGKPLY
jgi:hypothetical protein